MASRVGRGIALPFLDRGNRRGWVVNSTPQPLFTPGKDPVPIVQEAGWASGPVWTAENLAPPGFDPRTVQPIVSRYTDWATGPTLMCIVQPWTIDAKWQVAANLIPWLQLLSHLSCIISYVLQERVLLCEPAELLAQTTWHTRKTGERIPVDPEFQLIPPYKTRLCLTCVTV
jgi:hypothetical protein